MSLASALGTIAILFYPSDHCGNTQNCFQLLVQNTDINKKLSYEVHTTEEFGLLVLNLLNYS